MNAAEKLDEPSSKSSENIKTCKLVVLKRETIKIDKYHKIFSTVLILSAISYLGLKNLMGLDLELYIIAGVNEMLKNLDLLKQIKGGQALEPGNFVDL